jgi:hypothetical protein
MEKDLKYWQDNAEEDYMTTPISVLRYITELEKLNAPKMLEALKDMMFIFESLTDKLPTHYSEFNCYKQAKEVINQATKID